MVFTAVCKIAIAVCVFVSTRDCLFVRMLTGRDMDITIIGNTFAIAQMGTLFRTPVGLGDIGNTIRRGVGTHVEFKGWRVISDGFPKGKSCDL